MNCTLATSGLILGALLLGPPGPASATERMTQTREQAGAKTSKVLYDFPKGSMSEATLLRDKHGNLHGTTLYGGARNIGTVFRLSRDGTLKTLVSFDGDNGALPSAGLIEDGLGNFYGTSFYGGAYGWGTAFKMTAKGEVTVLHSFNNDGTDGYDIQAGLILDSSGNLFGAASTGGAHGLGTLFKIAPDGTETLLYSFGGADGATPAAGLVEDQSGNLYGTTLDGGTYGLGAVFEFSADGVETVLHSFNHDGTDGFEPQAALLLDSSGNLYGTTYAGGTWNGGTVFEILPDGAESVLHSFNYGSGDGSTPEAGLISDNSGNLYGTTAYGGTDDYGAVFMIAPDGTETVLYSLTKKTSGGIPLAGLTLDQKGRLYGTTSRGGRHAGGTIFEIRD